MDQVKFFNSRKSMVMFVLTTKFKFSSKKKKTILGRLATTISLRAYFSVETAGGDVYKSN